jgi:hypothetical protein
MGIAFLLTFVNCIVDSLYGGLEVNLNRFSPKVTQAKS